MLEGSKEEEGYFHIIAKAPSKEVGMVKDNCAHIRPKLVEMIPGCGIMELGG